MDSALWNRYREYLCVSESLGLSLDISRMSFSDGFFAEMQPRWLRIGGYWYPRGGIPIDVFWQSGAPPEGLWLPDQGVASYRGRG